MKSPDLKTGSTEKDEKKVERACMGMVRTNGIRLDVAGKEVGS